MNSTKKFKFSQKPNPINQGTQALKESENFTIEELKEYYSLFMSKYHNISEDLNKLKESLGLLEDKEKISQFENIDNSIKDLKEDFLNNSHFLVGYDKQNYSNLLEALSESQGKIKELIFPKKKFAFSNKSITINKSDMEIKPKVDLSSNFALEDLKLINKKQESLKFKQEDVQGKNNLILENISDSTIYILYNFKAAYLKNISNSTIHIGSVSGGSHITNCDDSAIYLATHQLRIHQSNRTIFNVLVNSSPIIEDCTELIFSPLRVMYPQYEENLELAKLDQNKNKWSEVLDFKWHKKEKSPHYEIRTDISTVEIVDDSTF